MTHIPSLARTRPLQAHIRRDCRVCGYDGGDQRHRSINRVVRLGASVQVPVADKFGNLRCTRDPHDLGAESRVSRAACFIPGASGLYCKNVAWFVDRQQCCRCVGLWPLMHMILTHPYLHSQSNIDWECQNGQQLWPASAAAGYGGTTAFPPGGICTQGFASLYTAVIVSLLVDMGFQVRRCGLLSPKKADGCVLRDGFVDIYAFPQLAVHGPLGKL